MSVMLDTGGARGFPGLKVWFPCACVQHRHKHIEVHMDPGMDFIEGHPWYSPQSCLQCRIARSMGEQIRMMLGFAFQFTEQL